MWRISDMWRILDFLLYTLSTIPSVTVAKNSSVHARIHLRMLTVRNSEAEILNSLKLQWNMQSNGHFATVSQVYV